MADLLLAKGQVALIDDEDAHWIGQRSWYLNARGYVACALFGRRGGADVLLHRLILLAPDTTTVDHINHDPLDNRRGNLRTATRSQQNANRRKFFGTSRYRGVHRRCDGLKWVAQIKPPHGRTLHLGSFESEVAAASAYNAKALELYGSFACLNQISEKSQ